MDETKMSPGVGSSPLTGNNTTSPSPSTGEDQAAHLRPSKEDNRQNVNKTHENGTLLVCQLQVLPIADKHRSLFSLDSKGTNGSDFKNSPEKGPVSINARTNCNMGSRL